MDDSPASGQGKSAAQRNLQYIQDLQLKQREALQSAKQQTEDKALLRERLSQIVLSRRTEDLKGAETSKKCSPARSTTMVDAPCLMGQTLSAKAAEPRQLP